MDYEDALKLATKMHEGQYRKNSDLLYITHPTAVADVFRDSCYWYKHETCRIVAILHDVIEDTSLTFDELEKYYDPSIDVMDALRAITKTKGQTYLDFILQVKENKIATYVKIEDIKHNLSNLEDGNLREKYLMALWMLCH